MLIDQKHTKLTSYFENKTVSQEIVSFGQNTHSTKENDATSHFNSKHKIRLLSADYTRN